MGTIKNIQTPLTKELIRTLHAGDSVLLSGVIYTARDAAHERMTREKAEGKPYPFDLEGQAVTMPGHARRSPAR